MEKRARWYDLLLVNLFWLGLNIRNNAVGTIFTPYLLAAFVSEDVRNTSLGIIRTAGLIIAMLVQPAMGLLSDRSTSRFGRRRPFIFVGVLLDLLFLAMIAYAWDFWALLVATLLIQFSANISHGAVQGLIPDLIPEKQRGVASGIKGVMELLPLILVALTIANLVGAGRFRLAVLATGLALLVIMLITVLLVKEEPLRQKPDLPLAPTLLRVLGMLAGIIAGAAAGLLAGGILGGAAWLVTSPRGGSSLARAVGIGLGGAVAMIVAVGAGVWAGTAATLSWKTALQNRPFVWWVVNRLFFFSAITSIQAFAPFFLMYTFGISREEAARMTGQLVAAVGVATMITALPGGWLGDRFGHRRMTAWSGVTAVIGTILILVIIWKPETWLVYTAGVVLGLAVGSFTASNWALGTNLVPQEEAGRYLGVSNLAGAGAGMVGSGIGGPVADLLNGYAPGVGYFALFAAYAVLFALSVVTLRWVRR